MTKSLSTTTINLKPSQFAGVPTSAPHLYAANNYPDSTQQQWQEQERQEPLSSFVSQEIQGDTQMHDSLNSGP